MQAPQSAVLLRIYTEEGRMHAHRPLYEHIVTRARARGLAGATVLRGPMGFGHHGRVHAAKLVDVSTRLPLVIEIVDEDEKIRGFLTELDEIDELGLVTLEKVEVLRYGDRPR